MKKSETKKSEPSRRAFVKTAALGGASLLTASGMAAASYERILGANDRANFGLIGFGHIAQNSHLERLRRHKGEARITGVCEIYEPRLEKAVAATGARGYHDYRELLAREELDAVVVCTPDHWHAAMSIDAMRAGKDVLCEKPMCMSAEQAKQMVEVSEETGQVLAIDSEHTAHGIWAPAQTAVRAGVLGKLLWSQTSRSRNTGETPPWNYEIEEQASPKNLNWERFLGPPPKVPFSKERFFRWRRYWDYGGGIATDLYYHHITPLLKVIGPAFPMRATAAGGHFEWSSEVMEVPGTFMMTLTFPGEHAMMVGGSLSNAAELPIVVRGHEANIFFHGPDQRRPAYLTIEPEAPYVEGFREKIRRAGLEGRWVEKKAEGRSSSKPATSAKPVYRIDAPPSESMTENFLRCMRTREQPVLDGQLGYRAQVAVSLAVEAYRENRVKFFDPVAEQVTSHPG